MRKLRATAAAALLLCAARVVVAQQMRGTVRGAANNPIPGAVVSQLDSAGSSVGRAFTDAEGRFLLALSPRSVRLRVIRIGYTPRDLALPRDLAAELEIVMERTPPVLETVRVTDNELCPGSRDQGAAFQLWEQARAGLLATIVARELKPATATLLTYESHLSPSDDHVRSLTKRLRSGQTTRPFIASAQPSFFAAAGYMIEDRGFRTFNAPDADVLVDESFAATHCFRLQLADSAHAGQVGLAFVPTRGRDSLVDVRGTIWVDVQNPQLRSLDFLYTSLEPAASQARAGGHIEFRSLANGVSFIERWEMRLPNLD